MSAAAMTLMVVVMVVIWGGLVASIMFLSRRPEAADMPPGGEDTQVPD
ncbi:methionine/alanine import family NSS transporter small subunit [Demequina sp. SYSU T00039]|uniref:Methionine/alanine import family NSS transporter small subunit n=1 Tax=Demequina lignilytica TaxID=3051663 RepID=A0AAW7M8R0_9MICO|nr:MULTISPECIES: methionine/alanine import family NSS transporter small subunit [unclassified Demequina]MDN4477063.1 methionine/alanine import family NSS transporter small subunit [Demequina sp. SYSU T00039-1]MDN4487236.1 methionine/alanine import family NSS transporter small subunit [Demequina sp. SYSU T00039]MDN4491769.1 methionine/alanine import family NSS transporter small subunit [Demequina sp. SYSU T00068]